MILLVYTNISHLKERLKEKARTPPSSTQESLPYASEVHTHTQSRALAFSWASGQLITFGSDTAASLRLLIALRKTIAVLFPYAIPGLESTFDGPEAFGTYTSLC